MIANYCKMCGTKLQPGNKFCMKCGTPVQEQMAVQQTAMKDLQATRSPNHGNNLVGMALIAAVLLFIGAGGYYLHTQSMAGDIEKTAIVDKTTANDMSKGNQKNQSAMVSAAKEDSLEEFVREKDMLDTDIGTTANRVNEYLANHSSFRGYDGLKNDVRNLVERANQARVRLNSTAAADTKKKQALLELFSLEEDRARGLYKGIVDNQNGGDYSAGFKQGTQASYAFDSANSKFNASFR